MDVNDVRDLRAQLACAILPWQQDGCVPANYVRKNGLGDTFAKVDRWLNGYQGPSAPAVIGWKVQVYKGGFGACYQGLVPVNVLGTEDVDAAIELALQLADEALVEALEEVMGEGKAVFVACRVDKRALAPERKNPDRPVVYHGYTQNYLHAPYHSGQNPKWF